MHPLSLLSSLLSYSPNLEKEEKREKGDSFLQSFNKHGLGSTLNQPQGRAVGPRNIIRSSPCPQGPHRVGKTRKDPCDFWGSVSHSSPSQDSAHSLSSPYSACWMIFFLLTALTPICACRLWNLCLCPRSLPGSLGLCIKAPNGQRCLDVPQESETQ